MKVRKSTTGPWSAGTRFRVPTHSTETTVLPARSAAWPMWSACRMPVVANARGVVEVALADPVERVVRRAVLARPGAGRERVPPDARVRREALEQAVLAGDALLHELAASSASLPASAYLSTRSGRMPSDGEEDDGRAPPARRRASVADRGTGRPGRHRAGHEQRERERECGQQRRPQPQCAFHLTPLPGVGRESIPFRLR